MSGSRNSSYGLSRTAFVRAAAQEHCGPESSSQTAQISDRKVLDPGTPSFTRLAAMLLLSAAVLLGPLASLGCAGPDSWQPQGPDWAASAPVFPLKKSANGRYLVDQMDVPFLIAGDAPQSLMVNISASEANVYFANRRSHGFNAVWINLLCNTGTAGRPDGSTYDGILPFTGYLPGHSGDPLYYDLATPNPAYFARCDEMLNLAASHDLLVGLDPIETRGWLPIDGDGNAVMPHNGQAACRFYGQYIGNRYRYFPNIIWMSGNDYLTWNDGVSDILVTAVALGIKDSDPNHLHTVMLDFPVSGSLDDPNWEPIIDLNASYTYYPTYAQVLKDYNRPNYLPVVMAEANYEFEHSQGTVDTTPLNLRKQEYWSLLSGATGQFYGNRFIWTFSGDWQSHLDTPGAIHMAYVQMLFVPRAWYNLVPDQTHTLVTAGYGTFSNVGYVEDNSYVTAARTPDGTLAIAYLPTIGSITVDMTQLSGPVIARWYDPTSGVYTAIDGSPFQNTGSRVFSSPGSNSDGDGDWALVLESASVTADHDNDGDVDMEDFGQFQVCVSGYAPQDNPACAWAKLAGHEYVNQADVTLFLRCLSGCGIPADPNCANSVTADHDNDGDVDMEDFGQFQVCLSGYAPQDNPACAWAKLAGHEYVNQADVTLFLACLSGSGIPADRDCAN